MSVRAAAGAAGAVCVLLVGCGAGPVATSAPPAAAEDAGQPGPVGAGPSVSLDGLTLTVTGAHLLPLSGTPGAQEAVARLGLPAAELAQVHLLLALHVDGSVPVHVGRDALELSLEGRTVPAATQDTFPEPPLAPGELLETAVGFDVPLREGAGAVLRWTHGPDVVELPIGSAPVAG